MSVTWLQRARGARLPQAAKAVLKEIAWYADDNGVAWPTVEGIAAACSMGRRTVQVALRLLEAEGWLTAQPAGRRRVYTLHTKGAGAAPMPTDIGAGAAPVQERHPSSGAGAQELHPRGAGAAPPYLTMTRKDNRGSAPALTDAHTWLTELYTLGWAADRTLTPREVAAVVNDFGMLDLLEEVKEHVAYWRGRQKPAGRWNTYLRLRKWLRNTRDRFGDARPAHTQAVRRPGGRADRSPPGGSYPAVSTGEDRWSDA